MGALTGREDKWAEEEKAGWGGRKDGNVDEWEGRVGGKEKGWMRREDGKFGESLGGKVGQGVGTSLHPWMLQAGGNWVGY